MTGVIPRLTGDQSASKFQPIFPLSAIALPMIERRSEPRFPADDLQIQVWGTDRHGMPFLQNALARNLSSHGALVTGIEQELRPGDLIGIQHKNHQARFRIVWIGHYSGTRNIMEVAVHRLDTDECPWKEALP